MIRLLPGQLDLPATEHRPAELAKLKARSTLLPTKPQKPMDIGLFSDEADQLDLVEMLQDPTNGE